MESDWTLACVFLCVAAAPEKLGPAQSTWDRSGSIENTQKLSLLWGSLRLGATEWVWIE